ncbi:MAG TPA: hypothetical protein PK581_03105 [Caldisericia bacterium]|jgi:hypothetical protein|nr:hypothetical protein [Caldisericia bacterium]
MSAKQTYNTFYRKVTLVLLFSIVLAVLFFIWYPVAPYYVIIRYWLSHKLLALVGFYPEFSLPQKLSIQGEYFSFLPFLALMISTYKTSIMKYWKYILKVLVLIVLMEVCGKFFEQWYSFQAFYLIYVFSIFLLASARVALPFAAWLLSIENSKTKLF